MLPILDRTMKLNKKAEPNEFRFSLPVYRASSFVVSNGANHGDALSFAEELEESDTYRLTARASVIQMTVSQFDNRDFQISNDSETGTPGAKLHLDSCITLMSPDGNTTEIVIIVETNNDQEVSEIYALPLQKLKRKTDYALIKIDTETAWKKMSEVACVSFTRGTRITMSDGIQKPIEEICVGDKVLTRDDGVQKVRWIGQITVRATGAFAPIVIKAGTLHNENDLLVSPEHRLFIYQRTDTMGVGRPELLIKARHLVNGTTVYRQDGGFVDYFQILFDRHQIIYAEGIAAETMLVNGRTKAAIPDDMAETLGDHGKRPHLDYEVNDGLLNQPNIAEILRRATLR